jgi:hypothetical protein
MAREIISGALPLAQERQLPENAHYPDDGCDLAPSCLTCPFVACRYDIPGGKRALLNGYRDKAIASLRQNGKAVPVVAELLGVSVRTVVRVSA